MGSEIQLKSANKVDQKILQLAGSHSPAEISARLGGVVSAGAVASRVQTLLKAKDWLTTAQEEQLLLWELKMALVEINERTMDKDMLKVKLAYTKAITDRLDKRLASTDIDLGVLYQNQGRIMGQVVDSALSYMKGALREQVDATLWEDLVKEAMYSAQAEIAKHEAIEQ